MAVLAFTGFEARSVANTIEVIVQGAPAITTSVVRTGNAALAITAASGGNEAGGIRGRSANGRDADLGRTALTYYTAHFRFEDIPTGTTDFLVVHSGVSNVVALQVNSSGQITMVGATTSAVIATVVADTWYRADLRVTSNATSFAKIDGGTEQSCTAQNLTQNVFYGGRVNTPSVVLTAYYDDFYIDTAAHPGAVKVVGLFPTGAGASSGWTTGTGSTFAEVDDWASGGHDTDTTYIGTSAASTVSTFDLTSCPTGEIKAVESLAISRTTSTTGTSSVSTRLRSGSTNSDTTAVELTTGYLGYGKYFDTDPQDSTAWTTSKVDACEVGVATVASAQPQRCTAMALMVAYVPSVVTPISPAGTLTTAGALANEIRPPTFTGTLTSSGALVRKATQALGGTLSTSGLLIRKATQALAGTLSTAGSLAVSRVVSLAADGALGTSGALQAKVSQAYAGALSTAGALVREAAKVLGGTLGTAGAVAWRVQMAFAGTLTTAGSLTASRVQRIALDGTLGTAGSLVNRLPVARIFEGTLATAGAISWRATQAPSGTLTTSGTLSSKAQRALAGTLTTAGSLAFEVSKALGGTLATSGALVLSRLQRLTAGGTLNSAGALARRVALSLSGTLTAAGTLAARLSLHLTFTGTLTTAGSLTASRVQRIALDGTLGTAGALVVSRRVPLSADGTLGLAGELTLFQPEAEPIVPFPLNASYVPRYEPAASNVAALQVAGAAAGTIALEAEFVADNSLEASSEPVLELAGRY